MAQVEVRDHVMWTRHIHGDPNLQNVLNTLPAEEIMTLRVAGELGVWRKMRANTTTGALTPGLQPIGPAATRWRKLYKLAKKEGGAVVEIEMPEAATTSGAAAPVSGSAAPILSRAPWERASPEEQRAAWSAIQQLWNMGWHSQAPYGPREELYERDEKL